MNTIKRIWRGLQWSEEYGDHPGTLIMVAFLLLGAVAGGWRGVIVFAVLYGPLYLYGAYSRGK
jgi:hypothetical protein